MTPFAVFFLRQFFLGIIPRGRGGRLLDGAGNVRIFFQIILPDAPAPDHHAGDPDLHRRLERVLLAAAGRLRPTASRVLTVALGVFKSQTPQTGPDWAGLMAATCVAALPILVLFIVFGQADRQLHRLLRHQVRQPPMPSSTASARTALRGPQRAVGCRARRCCRRAAACGGGGQPAARPTAPSSYWLWDADQQPGYQKCADAFQQAEPRLRSRSPSTAGTTTGPSSPPASSPTPRRTSSPTTCPSTPEFVDLKVLRPLDDLAATSGHQRRRLPAGPGRAVEGPGRQAVRPAEGLGHHRHLLQQGRR